MIIKNKIDNEAVLSNVGEVGEFRIRNSAKAFSILSSGLYANKIRAIIREYSCNAVDSHFEAGRTDTPFDIHLPNSLEPWFSIRDYGVGLDEQQVRNIFTTYFESTKTETDDLIGGLGLGSKSAFSYTDNFTIVAVKNGIKRVYTAFINDQGVPSIAPMGEEGSNEPAGVEIRFAVEDSYDFRKFQEEARHVYKHFKLRPVVSGGIGEFTFIDAEYEDRDIIPGIHSNGGHRNNYSYAIMGNIEYPLQVPGNADLGGLEHLLQCGLTIEFGIGELDIQASREGLSYIPETIAAIKAKLEALNNVLVDKIASEGAAIKNNWEKAFFYKNKLNSNLWGAATKQHLTDINFDLINFNRYGDGKTFHFTEADLAQKYNIKITAFRLKGNYYGDRTAATVYTQNVYDNNKGHYTPNWAIQVAETTKFVENDTTVGAGNRAKYHWRNSKDAGRNDYVYVLEKADKKKDMKVKSFFKALSNPPAKQIFKASALMQKERAAGIAKGVNILKLEKRDNNHHMRSNDMVWRAAGDITSFDNTKTYYYLPMSGLTAQFAIGSQEAGRYTIQDLSRAVHESGILTDTIYGVRKADLEKIKSMSNWVSLDEFVVNKLTQKGVLDVNGIIKEAIGFDTFFKFYYIHHDITNADSPYVKLYNRFVCVNKVNTNARRSIETLCKIYNVTAENVNVTEEINKYNKEMEDVKKRYPLLDNLDRYFYDQKAMAEYINAIDMLKGI
jgi:hypothetical protein